MRLIPRLREWIDQHYPGTQLAITEWNWGAEQDISGGLAAAEVLGIFGREGVDIATHWGRPPVGSPVYWAFRMFRNYDGVGGAFGDRSLPSTNSDPESVSSFASLGQDARLRLMLINKDDERAIDVRVELSGVTDANVEAWLYGADTGRIVQLPSSSLAQGVLSHTLPPYSITLLIVDSAAD